MSTVDVIVPCYRYGHFLRECVESVLSQSGPSVRVRIIDDASPDDTKNVAADLAERDARVTVVSHSSNRGHIATYNEGLDWASAEFVLLLSADDYLLPGALNRATSLMERHSEVGFVFGNAVELDERGQKIPTNAIPCQNGERVLACRDFVLLNGARNIVPSPTAVVRTKLHKKVGKYRTELPHAGDMEMWLRLAAHASVGFIQASQAVYRIHTANMSLSYTANNWLPDLEQRKSAFDCFFRACQHLLPDPVRLRKKLLYALACDAVSHASTAFNDGDLELCGELAAFARRMNSNVARSLPWAKLSCKHIMGVRFWRAVQPLVSSLRRSPHQTRELQWRSLRD
jgi:glycosyltransferase involved in cell wall biosynthesis